MRSQNILHPWHTQSWHHLMISCYVLTVQWMLDKSIFPVHIQLYMWNNYAFRQREKQRWVILLYCTCCTVLWTLTKLQNKTELRCVVSFLVWSTLMVGENCPSIWNMILNSITHQCVPLTKDEGFFCLFSLVWHPERTRPSDWWRFNAVLPFRYLGNE